MKKNFVLIVIISSFLLSIAASEEPTSQKIEIAGFRDLKWGISTEEATKIYSDMVFDRKFDRHTSVYKRKGEDKSIGGVDFDFIEYFFGTNGFSGMQAHIDIPYWADTMDRIKDRTRVSLGFSLLKKNIEAKYGPSTDFKEEGSQSGLFKKQQRAIWLVGAGRIELTYMEGFARTFRAPPRELRNTLWLKIENVQPKTKLGF